jgi:hypothetical protein
MEDEWLVASGHEGGRASVEASESRRGGGGSLAGASVSGDVGGWASGGRSGARRTGAS